MLEARVCVSAGEEVGAPAALVDRAELPDRPVVLDLAAGTGDFSLIAAQRYPGARAVAVDLTERMLQLARERGVRHTVCANAGLLPFAA